MAKKTTTKKAPAKETMKAMIFYEKKKMQLEEVPIPEPGDDELLVKVEACGVCGSDIAYYYGISSLETPSGKGPLVLGHEFSGTVVKVGATPRRLKLFQEGQRVVLDPVQSCNTCRACITGHPNLCTEMSVLGVSTNGGFAEYCLSKYTGTKLLPDNVSFEIGAMTEPLACATYAVKNLDVEPGNLVVVYGPGPIGNMMAQLAKASGAREVVMVGTRDYRLELAKKAGAGVVLNPKDKKSPYYCSSVVRKIKEMTDGLMAERAIVATSAVTAMKETFKITGKASTIVFFGLPGDKDVVPIPALDTMFGDKAIRFSWLAPFTWPAALGAISGKLVNLKDLASHRLPLKDTIKGIEMMKNRKNGVMKPIVIPSL